MEDDDLHLRLAAINARLCGFTNTARALESAFFLERTGADTTKVARAFRRRRHASLEAGFREVAASPSVNAFSE